MRLRTIRYSLITLVGILVVIDVSYFGQRGSVPLVATEETRPSFRPISVPLTPEGRADCGALSLSLIGKRFGIDKPLSELRRITHTSNEGVSMLDLKNAALELGFEVTAQRVSFQALHDHLRQSNSSAILHFESGHFAPALGTAADRIRMIDVLRGIKDVDQDILSSARYGWQGDTLLLSLSKEKYE